MIIHDPTSWLARSIHWVTRVSSAISDSQCEFPERRQIEESFNLTVSLCPDKSKASRL